MRTIILFFILITAAINGYAQQYESHRTMIVDVKGYFIYINGYTIFQPTEDTTRPILETFDMHSFSLWFSAFQSQPYCDALVDAIRDSTYIDFTLDGDTVLHHAVLKAMYCKIKVTLGFDEFSIRNTPAMMIVGKDKKYPLIGYWIRNILWQIIPCKMEDRRRMCAAFDKNGQLIPDWLTAAVKE